MGADYAGAVWVPSQNFWQGNQGMDWIVVHATASGGVQTAMQLATSSEFTDGKTASVQYINDRDTSQVVQIVAEGNSAWGNCCVDGNSLWPSTSNWNLKTISIENVKYSSDNSEALTPWQYQSLLALVRDIAKRHSIPLVHGSPTRRGIIFHHDLMPIAKARCPGTFPYDTFFQDLNGGSVIHNSKGMVADIVQSNQLSENEMDLCGPWAVAALLYAGAPTKGPTGTAEQIDQWVDAAVGVMGYPNPADFPGVSVADEEWLLQRSGLHYQEIASDVATIRLAVAAGYPVIITAFEPNIKAWSFQSNSWVNAYTWNISANHVFPVAGFDQNGNLICADQLNNAFQGYWPPIYDASRINPSYAAVVRLPFLAPIPSADPHTWPLGFSAQGGSMPVPSGWTDNGSTLVAPNKIPVVFGFRAHVINAPSWNPIDVPLEAEVHKDSLEESNPGIGAGQRQTFRNHILEYTPAMGVFEGFAAQELFFVRADRDAKATALSTANASLASANSSLSAANTSLSAAAAQIADLQAQLATAAKPLDPAIKADLSAAAASLADALLKLP